MEILTLYRLDRWDGGERHLPTPYHFRSKTLAEKISGKHDNISETCITIVDSEREMIEAEEAVTAKGALDRLSDKERMALGLPADKGAALEHLLNLKKNPPDQ